MPRPIYFRPKLDILYIDVMFPDEITSEYPEVNEIESIAIPIRSPRNLDLSGKMTGMKSLFLVTALEEPWPWNRCCSTIELSPNPDHKERELEWTDYISMIRRYERNFPNRPKVPNIEHVEAVVGKLDGAGFSYLMGDDSLSSQNPAPNQAPNKRKGSPPQELPRKLLKGKPRDLSLPAIVSSGDRAQQALVVRNESPWDTFSRVYECELAGSVAVVEHIVRPSTVLAGSFQKKRSTRHWTDSNVSDTTTSFSPWNALEVATSGAPQAGVSPRSRSGWLKRILGSARERASQWEIAQGAVVGQDLHLL
ncbi:hypothetical protein I7I51_06459 [Histoplasma capsulatum]|uniref:Uncharacterized protein n=1 Tax=Ajellomyces capsulatus TaxID=5037 RepID=A0A8A1MLU9_AJECA|nr:hypothetical protein I7I51_06459 [Histoplasma capsulatum]